MDFLSLKDKAMPFLMRYRYVLLILMVGILLMAVPDQEEPSAGELPAPQESMDSLQEELAHILSKIQGAGKVEVLLTEGVGAETLFQTNVDRSSDTFREDTVVVSDAQRREEGLVRQVNPPRYAGAVVVCQGGDHPGVKLSILEAVMKATGLKSNQISVLKMK